MKKHLAIAAVLLGALACSCSTSSVDDPIKTDNAADILILNNGNWNSNDASITGYNINGKTVEGGLFYKANDKHLGDIGQDIIADGDYLVVAVFGSKKIFVTRKDLSVYCEINYEKGDTVLSPRHLATYGDKLYVTYYEGFLGEISGNFGEGRTTQVGPNPEGLDINNGKIFVANSGGYVDGYDNTVSVVDAASFEDVTTVTVGTNPNMVVAAGDYVYVSSYGNYADIPAALHRISVKDYSVEKLDYSGVNSIALGKDGILYVLCGVYDASWQLSGTVYAYDTAAGKDKGVFASDIASAYSISADPSTGYVFVGVSDYTSNGDMLIYKADGTLYDKVDTEGLNPIKAIVL